MQAIAGIKLRKEDHPALLNCLLLPSSVSGNPFQDHRDLIVFQFHFIFSIQKNDGYNNADQNDNRNEHNYLVVHGNLFDGKSQVKLHDQEMMAAIGGRLVTLR